MKLLKRKSEKGNIFVKVIIGLIALIFVAIYGMQVGMGFLEKRELNKYVQQTIDGTDIANTSTANIKADILKRISVSTIEIKQDDIDVQKSGTGVVIIINHKKEIPISQNIMLVLDLGVEKEN